MMMLLGFVATILILVTVHEFGHFLAARACGVKVLRFSVGFGKPFYSFYDRKGTEFALAPIPLGGYVKMLDTREAQVSPELLPVSFNHQPLWQRAIIVAAGPLINLLLAVVLYFALFTSGYQYQPAVIGDAIAESPAAGQVESGWELVSLNDRRVLGWSDAFKAMSFEAGSGAKTLDMRFIDASGADQQASFTLSDIFVDPQDNPFQRLGLLPKQVQLPAVIGDVVDGYPASLAGLKAGDRIVAIDGESISYWQEMTEIVRANPERELNLRVERGSNELEIRLTPRTVENDGIRIGQMGASLDSDVMASYYQPQTLKLGLVDGLIQGVSKTSEMVQIQLVMLGKLVTGQLSTDHIGGPISIAKTAGSSVDAGLQSFVLFLAAFSVMLGVLNLLPIPVLDGGHLLLMAAEWVRGKPLSDQWQARLTQFGLLLVLFLTFFAISKDLMNL